MNRNATNGRRHGARPPASLRRTPPRPRALAVAATVTVAVALGCIGPSHAAAAAEPDSLQKWQLRRLFQPTERELAHEREGHVYIYDGLTDREVDEAMTRQFGRIEYMMFLGTLQTAPDGAVRRGADGKAAAESLGCDE